MRWTKLRGQKEESEKPRSGFSITTIFYVRV